MAWRSPGDRFVAHPVPLPADADAGQPPTLSAQPSAAKGETRPLGTLAQEFKRVVNARHPLGKSHVGVAQLSRTILVLFSGPYDRADGLVTFLRRLRLRVMALDNDASNCALLTLFLRSRSRQCCRVDPRPAAKKGSARCAIAGDSSG